MLAPDFEKYTDRSLREIADFKKEIAYTVKLPGFPIDKAIATSSWNSSGGFTIKIFSNDSHAYTFKHKELGIYENLILNRSNEEYLVKKGSDIRASISFSQPQVITIEVNSFQSAKDDLFDGKKLRLLIPCERVEFKGFQLRSLKINSTTFMGGLIEVEIDSVGYHIFNTSAEGNDNYLIIESQQIESLIKFKENCRSILLAIGLITGNLIQGEFFIQSLNDKGIVEDIAYELLEKSVLSNANLFDPTLLKDFLVKSKQTKVLETIQLHFDSRVFQQLCQTIKSNDTYARCIQLVIEGTQTSLFLLRASIYSIAIETMANVIYEENQEKENPILDFELARKIVSEMTKILEQFSIDLTEYGKTVLQAKINDLNKPTNSKRLSLAFEILGIKLSDEERKILKHRNKFLHGTSPFNEKELPTKTNEVIFITEKMHFMISCLLLKYVGYTGHIVNFGAWHQYYSNKEITDEPFKII